MKREYNTFGDEFWYDDKNQYHREDGPAIIRIEGDMLWYIHGYLKKTKDQYGNQYWVDENGKLHKEDGPAVLFNFLSQEFPAL
jgi:hypothetical protein